VSPPRRGLLRVKGGLRKHLIGLQALPVPVQSTRTVMGLVLEIQPPISAQHEHCRNRPAAASTAGHLAALQTC
jgi:hypothetical protein